jgi:ferredoxin-NADP reductase
MTASTLLLYISACLLGQVALAAAYALLKQKVSPPVQRAAPMSPDIAAGARQSAAWSGLREFKVQRRTFEDPTHTQCSFYLAPVDGTPLPEFKPGQFLTFSIAVPVAGRDAPQAVTRCYSLSDAPVSDAYRITVKRVPAPSGQTDIPAGLSSNYFHDHMQEGGTVTVRAPSGHFYLDAQSQTPVVLIAGGIGITPMMSMLRWCTQHQPQRLVHLFYGLRNSSEHAFKQVLQDIAAQTPNLRLHIVYSRPMPTDVAPLDYQHQGHVDIALLKETLPHGAHQFYICGPSAMLESLVPALAQWGVAEADIHFEAFGPASVRLPQSASEPALLAEEQALQIQFKRSGRTLAWTGRDASLLDFAERHGIAIESGCRSGSCGSCVTAVASGTVHYDAAPDYDLSGNECLMCVGKPRSALVLEA